MERNYFVSFGKNFKIEGESILLALDLAGVSASSGSACSAASIEPSHVLLAMGLSKQNALETIRIGIGRFNTKEEIIFAAKNICQGITKIKKMNKL